MTEPRARLGEEVLEELVALSRRSLHGEAIRRGERTFEQTRKSLRARREKSRARARWLAWPRVLAWGLPTGALCALGLYLWIGTQTPLRYEVSGAVAMASGDIVGGEQSRLRFTDGSELTLSRGARARVLSLDPRGGHIEIGSGKAHVSIERRPQTRWFVRAGPYEVRVIGTTFDVRWSQSEKTFELTMQRGEVTVTGPLLQGAVRVRAGQGLRASLDAQRVWMGDALMARAEPSSDNAQPSVVEAGSTEGAGEDAIEAPSERMATRRDSREAPHKRERLSRGGRGPWARRLARGDSSGVLAEAERFGIERALSSAPLHELAALADAARFVRRGELARRALLSARKRFPRSAVAADAAFLLGRIEERRGGNRAVRWYARYLRENPRGPYAEQALGRHMLHVYRTEGAAAARSLAATYLERHATGAYADAARRLVSGAVVPPDGQ